MVFGVCPRGTAQILIAQKRNIFCKTDTSSARLAELDGHDRPCRLFRSEFANRNKVMRSI